MDTFDKIRSAIWQNQTPAITGLNWKNSYTFSQDSYPIRGIISEEVFENDPKSAHAFTFCWVKYINGQPYLIAHLSNGIGFGDKGHFYFPRSVINRECTFGTAIFVDMPLGVAKKINTSKYSPYWNLKIAFMWNVLYKINEILKALLKHQGDE